MKKRVTSLLLAFAIIVGALALVACSPSEPKVDPTDQPIVTKADITEPTIEPKVDPTEPADPEVDTAEPVALHRDSPEIDAKYLNHYFGINLTGDIDEGNFVESLVKLQGYRGTEVNADQPGEVLQALKAVKYAVIAAGLEELALVYTPDQLDAALKGYESVEEAYACFVACALDMGLLHEDDAKKAVKNDKLDAELANRLLMAVADYNGTARNFAGYSDDPLTYSRIMNLWASVEMSPDPLALFSDKELLDIGSKTLMDRATTGFIITDTARHARFLPELTLQYAHDDVKHIKQMLGLLQSHNIVVKVQVEPKLSIYQYFEEYGYEEPTATYAVREISEDFSVVDSVNCDVELEFASLEDLDRFNTVISDYAKKNSGEEGKALLYKSWWQPIYESMAERDVSTGDYFKIYDHLIKSGRFVLRVSTKEDILDILKASAPDVDIEQIPIWINAAYYRYLLGETE